jgi:hypothetical protein
MKQSTKISAALALTAIVCFAAGSYLANKNTIKAFANMTREVEVTNEVSRVETWDRIEQFLVKGCTKQALELVRIEKSSALSAIKYQLGSNTDLMSKVKERNPDIARRVDAASIKGTYSIPACNERPDTLVTK